MPVGPTTSTVLFTTSIRSSSAPCWPVAKSVALACAWAVDCRPADRRGTGRIRPCTCPVPPWGARVLGGRLAACRGLRGGVPQGDLADGPERVSPAATHADRLPCRVPRRPQHRAGRGRDGARGGAARRRHAIRPAESSHARGHRTLPVEDGPGRRLVPAAARPAADPEEPGTGYHPLRRG